MSLDPQISISDFKVLYI